MEGLLMFGSQDSGNIGFYIVNSLLMYTDQFAPLMLLESMAQCKFLLYKKIRDLFIPLLISTSVKNSGHIAYEHGD